MKNLSEKLKCESYIQQKLQECSINGVKEFTIGYSLLEVEENFYNVICPLYYNFDNYINTVKGSKKLNKRFEDDLVTIKELEKALNDIGYSFECFSEQSIFVFNTKGKQIHRYKNMEEYIKKNNKDQEWVNNFNIGKVTIKEFLEIAFDLGLKIKFVYKKIKK
jgi:hypothetical protein